MPPANPNIYHMTHVNDRPSIIAAGELNTRPPSRQSEHIILVQLSIAERDFDRILNHIIPFADRVDTARRGKRDFDI